jgi:glycosyltransferase involved in cell wall biosynthesis
MEISIITTTLNSRAFIGDLANDVLSQSDPNFIWIIIDGGSTDGTLEFLRGVIRPSDIIVSEQDFGIYDAINKGINLASSRYYMIAGADDRIYTDTLKTFNYYAKKQCSDVIAASINYGALTLHPNEGKISLKGQNALIANHSVSTIFKIELHSNYGLYTNKFPICADQFFLRKIYESGATFYFLPNYIAGYFSDTGVTHTDYFGTLTEFTRVQLYFEKNKLFQILLFAMRCLKNLKKIIY